MRLLLDTHVLVWLAKDARLLSGPALTAIVDPATIPHFSTASVWEAEIKKVKGQLDLPPNLWSALDARNFTELSITRLHCETAARLPRHHKDPFDRMLVAQVLVEGLTLVTADRELATYGIPVLW